MTQWPHRPDAEYPAQLAIRSHVPPQILEALIVLVAYTPTRRGLDTITRDAWRAFDADADLLRLKAAILKRRQELATQGREG